MTKGEKQEIIMYGYRDSLALHDEGFTSSDLEELLELYEEKELYLTCAGIKMAIDEIKQKYEKDLLHKEEN